jgi:dolichyl-diphosphooligosaccharide--protein glycosyltransferase
VLLGVEVLVVTLVAAVGFSLRMIPLHVVEAQLASPLLDGIPEELKQFGYLYGNDPWIEYWQARYLYEHGLGAWTQLTPDNPATRVFWYPWGRDFTQSSYPFIPALAAATYTLVADVFSLQKWIAVIPPIMSLLLLAAGYLYMRMVFGRLPALATLPLLYLVPATLDRTHAGFVEKEGVSLGFVVLGLLLLGYGLRSRSMVWCFAGGLVLGFIGFMWGGYRLVALLLPASAALVLLAAAFEGRSEAVKISRLLLAAAVGETLALLLATPFAGVRTPVAILPLAGCTVVVLLYELAYRVTKRAYGARAEPISVKAYLASLLALALAFTLVAPMLNLFSGRILYTILWPFRGFFTISPLVQSIAEHTPLFASPASLHRINILLVTGFVGSLVALLYMGIYRRMYEAIPAATLALGALYGVIGMVYLLQTASVAAALVTPAIVYPLLAKPRTEPRRGRRGRVQVSPGDEVKKAVAGGLILLLLISAAYNASIAYSDVRGRIPSVLTSNGPFVNPGWLKLLELLRRETSNDTVVVTWWDYGYWVSVGSGRPSLADGATINGSQISLLAKMLVGDENTSSRIMESFGLKPGKTLVLVHDVALYVNGNIYYLHSIDLPKSYWMVRIGGYNVADYFEPRTVGRFATPTREGTRNGLLYNMLADAAYRLASNDTSVITNVKPPYVVSVYLVPPGVATPDDAFDKPELTHFKPKWIIAYGVRYTLAGGGSAVMYTIIAVYEWIG